MGRRLQSRQQVIQTVGRLAIAMALLAAGAAQAATEAIDITDDRGRAVHFEQPPARIVSLLPSITENVCALGACDRLVGVDRYSNEPKQVQALPRLGGLDDAQVERIVALRPDVVLVSRSARVADRLEALGFRVLAMDSNRHADVQRSLEQIARLLGTPQAGARVWNGIQRDIAAAAARVPQPLRGQRVYFEIGDGPFGAGESSFIGETLARLGMANVLSPELGPFPKLNPEFVVRSRPDIVMADQRALRAMADRPGWQGLKALQPGRSCGFEPARYELLVRPGPRLGEGARILADCLAGLSIEAGR